MSAASAPAKDVAPSASVQRQADSVFRWIKIQSVTPRKPVKAASKQDVSASAAVSGVQAPAQAVSAVSAPVDPAPQALQPPPIAATVIEPSPPIGVAVVETSATHPIDAEAALKPIAQPKPDFPEDVMAKLGKGAVKLRFVVQPDGTVSVPEVVSSSHRRLNQPALTAIAQWRFEPIREARAAQVEIGFDLD